MRRLQIQEGKANGHGPHPLPHHFASRWPGCRAGSRAPALSTFGHLSVQPRRQTVPPWASSTKASMCPPSGRRIIWWQGHQVQRHLPLRACWVCGAPTAPDMLKSGLKIKGLWLDGVRVSLRVRRRRLGTRTEPCVCAGGKGRCLQTVNAPQGKVR